MNSIDQTSLNESNSTCDPDRLSRFLLGSLSGEELANFETHLSDCESCQRRLEHDTADSKMWSEALTSLRDESDSTHEFDSEDSATYISRMVLKSLAPTDDPKMLGRLGPYEISGVIGQGGMGVVLKGFDAALNRYVALKVLRPYLAISGAARQRFFREAKAAATINHENVMPIHSVSEHVSEHNELPYLVMPYARGESLQQRVTREGAGTAVEVVRIGMQIAMGLAAAHEQGLVHRDIKPANIILDDGVEKLWITDFGLARLVDDASLTRTGVIAGTPDYMSPEQARGETIDERSDLFSLGAVLYTVCCGHPPFRAKTPYAVMRRITDDEPRSIRSINEDIPEWLECFVIKLLSKDPSERFESAQQTAELLRDSLAHLQHPTAFDLPPKVKSLVPVKTARLGLSKAILPVMILLAAFVIAWMLVRPSVPDWFSTQEESPAAFSPAFTPIPNANPSTVASNLDSATQEPTNTPATPVQAKDDVPAQANKLRSDQILPANTHAWVSIPDFKKLNGNLDKTQLGILFDQPVMKPFVDQLNVDAKQLLSDLGLPIDLGLLQSDWVQGEVCFAFSDATEGLSFNRVQETKEIIAPILLIDVGEFEDEAFEAVCEYFKKLRGAKGQVIRELENSRAATTNLAAAAPFFLQKEASITHAVCNGWLMIGAHQLAFRNHSKILREGREIGALAVLPAFRKSMAQTRDDSLESDIKWFVNPVGFAEILQRLDKRRRKDDWLTVLEQEGMDAFVGIGGRISLATIEHELLHRTFVCTSASDAKKKNFLGLFDFDNTNGNPMSPPIWVPSSASRCLVANWNKQSALSSVGPLYDAFLDERGAFQRTLADFKADPDMRLDLGKFVTLFEQPTVLVSSSGIDGEEENQVLGFKLKSNSEYVIESIKRAIGPHRKYKILGYEVLETISTEKEAGFLEIEDESADNLDQPQEKLYAFAKDVLIVSSSKKLITDVLKTFGETWLSESEDFIQARAALGKLTESENIGIRSFARLDRSIESDYELFRKGEFVWKFWVFDLFGDQANDPNRVARPKPWFDGSRLPKDFRANVAPFFGLSGWVLENKTDGFLIIGCWLKD